MWIPDCLDSLSYQTSLWLRPGVTYSGLGLIFNRKRSLRPASLRTCFYNTECTAADPAKSSAVPHRPEHDFGWLSSENLSSVDTSHLLNCTDGSYRTDFVGPTHVTLTGPV